MPTAIRVVLADLPGIADGKDDIKSALQQFFDTAVSRMKIDAAVTVSWSADAPALGDKDLLCYFVRHYADTIVAGSFARDQKSSKDDAGLTLFKTDKTVACEVYLNKVKKAGDAARLALQELMHNMYRKGEAMHQPGMSIGAAQVEEGAALSDGDMKWIAAHLLKTARTQWTGGYSAYRDPLRGAL